MHIISPNSILKKAVEADETGLYKILLIAVIVGSSQNYPKAVYHINL